MSRIYDVVNDALRRVQAKLNPWFVKHTGGDVWLHFCDDTEPDSKFWIRRMPQGRLHVTMHPTRFGLPTLGFDFGAALFVNLWGTSLRIGDGEIGLGFRAGTCLWLTVESHKIIDWLAHHVLAIPKYEKREIGVSFHDKAVWWSLWANPDSWSSGTPRWKYGNWHPLDTFFGRAEYTSLVKEVADVVVPMPEKGYRATVRVSEDTWRRPRAWWTRRRTGVNVEMVDPIPVPGKGENSWDCGDDALHGLLTHGDGVIDGVLAAMRAAHETRRRHGGSSWKPDEAAS